MRIRIPIATIFIYLACIAEASADPALAISFGDGNCGKLQGGEALPCQGSNFKAFSSMACTMGRNYLHPLVQKTIIDAFKILEQKGSKRIWQYGEMGKEAGGSLWPHKSHQNGLAADFFMPVLNTRGEPGEVPISAFNKFGYGLEFDKSGRLGDLRIEWSAIGEHLAALEAAGQPHKVRIKRIIITPPFHERLFTNAPSIRRLQPLFMKREAWVRHDEHYHVDFELPPEFRRPLKCR